MKVSGATGEVLWSEFWGPSAVWNESAFTMDVDSEGNLLVGGRRYIEINGDDFLVLKFDGSDGSVLWEYTRDGSPSLNDRVWDVVCDSNDDVIATGVAYDNDGEALFVTFKLDSDGNFQWVREESGAVQNTTLAGWLDVDASDNVVMVNRSWVVGEGYNVVMRKYASLSGSTQWTSEYNGVANGTDDPRYMCMDSDDNLLITGVSNGDFMTLKCDGTDGSIIWNADYNGPPGWYDMANFVCEGPGGEILVTGFSDGGTSGWDVLIQAIDSELGKDLWTLRHNGPDNLTDEGSRLAISDQGDIYVVGYSYFFGTDQDQLAIRYAPVSTDIPAHIAGTGRLSAWPNPFSATTTLRLALEQDQNLEIGIFDVSGRKVHTLAKGMFTAGDRELVWDGRDSAGRQLPAGVYFASVSSAKGQTEGTKLLMLK